MNRITIEKPTRVRILIADAYISVMSFLIIGIFMGIAAGVIFLTFFLFEIFDAR
jgi:hypothetical protein